MVCKHRIQYEIEIFWVAWKLYFVSVKKKKILLWPIVQVVSVD